MPTHLRRWILPGLALLTAALGARNCSAQIRDGGIDPWNLGKGDWIYYMSDATNKLGHNISAVTNENSLMLWYKNQGVRYVIVKAATSDTLFNGSYTHPQFTSRLVNIAHTNGISIMGYNRSYGQNVPAEIGISDYVFNQGADGFVWDAESEWESGSSWIGANGPALAWRLCSTVRSNWPTKFLAHAPFPIISYHSSFPYKEFGYWSDTVMPQIYPQDWTGVHSRPSGGINWTDVNWYNWQKSLNGASSVINGQTIYWTNAIKPLAPINHVYGPNPPNSGVTHIPDEFVMEFVDYLSADPYPQTVGGYKGANFWRADLHGTAQWANIKASTIGSFTGIVNNVVIDNPTATKVGNWTSTRTFYNGSFYGNGSGTDYDSFGTNYQTIAQGSGTAYVEFTPNILVAGDYDVYQWHPTLANASASAPFVINFSGGTATVRANQQTNAGNWSLLGRFNFAAGTSGTIRVLDNVAELTAVAIADGVKLVFAGAGVGPPTSPSIINDPQDLGLAPGQAAVFSVIAAGSEPLHYQWRRNSNEVPGATSSTLTISAASASDVGAYSVFVTNAYGSVTSATAMLTINSILAKGDNGFSQSTVPPIATNLIAIAAGEWHNLGLRSDGVILSWGNNYDGQCDIPPALNNAIAIAAGGYHSLAIRMNGTVIGWGANSYGQATSPANLKNVLGIAAGTWHSLALRADGKVLAWGDNSWGQTDVPPDLTDVLAVAAAGNHSLALKTNGTVVAWGDNFDADGNFVGQSAVPAGLTNVVAIAAGQYHSLVVKSDGTVLAWGDNSQAQCDLPPALSSVVAISGGGAHSVALKADGSVLAWGNTLNGQCDLPSLTNAVAIAAGETHSLVLVDGLLPRPMLFNPASNGSQFSALVQTLYRKGYALEFITSLGASNWNSLAPVPGNGALKILCDPAASSPRRFYRLRRY